MHLNIANYEVGVIFPPENNSTEMKNSIVGSLINFPPHTYTATDEPFMFTFTWIMQTTLLQFKGILFIMFKE